MQYAAYITRADHWDFESRERFPITKAEWIEYAANDLELQPIASLPAYDARTGDKMFDVPVEAYWDWIAYSRRTHRRATFEYDRGGLIVRAPDAEVLRKASYIASALDARVIGDDDAVLGEIAP